MMQVLLRIGWLGLKSIFWGRLFILLLLSKNWLRKAKCRDTWIGIGTIILVADIVLEFFWSASEAVEPVVEVDMLFPLPPNPDDVIWHPPVFILFHLALLFWNQIFTCTSLSPNLFAKSDLSFNVKYFLVETSEMTYIKTANQYQDKREVSHKSQKRHTTTNKAVQSLHCERYW